MVKGYFLLIPPLLIMGSSVQAKTKKNNVEAQLQRLENEAWNPSRRMNGQRREVKPDVPTVIFLPLWGGVGRVSYPVMTNSQQNAMTDVSLDRSVTNPPVHSVISPEGTPSEAALNALSGEDLNHILINDGLNADLNRDLNVDLNRDLNLNLNADLNRDLHSDLNADLNAELL